MKRLYLSRKEIFRLYPVSRKISLSLDRVIASRWEDLLFFFRQEDRAHQIDQSIDIVSRKDGSYSMPPFWRALRIFLSRGYLTAAEASHISGAFICFQEMLKLNDKPLINDIVELRMRFSEIEILCFSKIMVWFPRKNAYNIEVEHFNQSLFIEFESIGQILGRQA